MEAKAATEFAYTSLDRSPLEKNIEGITLFDESPGFTGIYYRDHNGRYWPCRTVDQAEPEHHYKVCSSWLKREGIHQDRREAKGTVEVCCHVVSWRYDMLCINGHVLSDELRETLATAAEERAKEMIPQGYHAGELNCYYVFGDDEDVEIRGWWEIT